MEARALTKYIRISPRKMRLVIDLVRFRPLAEAQTTLRNLNKKAARLVEKTLASAAANAKQKKMVEERLYVKEIRADGGPMLKRFMARSMGRADVILKRLTHLDIVLAEGKVHIAPQTPKGPHAKGVKLKTPLQQGRKTKQAATAGASS